MWAPFFFLVCVCEREILFYFIFVELKIWELGLAFLGC